MCFKTKGLYKCGKCPECLQERRLSWSLRLIQESRERPCFSALLTYRPSDVPMCEDGMSLCKKDVQLFLKRLRHYFDGKISYYISGEYSPTAFRPHYHCLFFGFPENLTQNQIKEILQKTWRLGFIGSYSNWLRSSAQINYATNYIINLYDWKKDDKRVRPFNLISKGLALDYHPDNNHYLLDKDIARVPLFGYDEIVVDGKKHIVSRWSVPLGSRAYLEHCEREVFEPFYYDYDEHCLKLVPEFENVLDYVKIKIQQTSYNFRTNQTRLGNVQSFKMPRVWRERVIPKDIQRVINIVNQYDIFKKEQIYLANYGEYDKQNPDCPMWKQIKLHKWKQRKKSKKDKLLSDPEHYLK